MSESDAFALAGAFGVAAIIIGVLFLLVMLVVLVFFLRTLYRCSEALNPAHRVLPSGLIWLSLIPGLNLVWNIVVVVTLSGSLKKEDAARGTNHFGDGGLLLGLLFTLSPFVTWIPLLGLLLALGAIVVWILYWNKISGFTKVLQSAGPIPNGPIMTPPPASGPTVPPAPVAPPMPLAPQAAPAAPVAPPPAAPVAPVPPPVIVAPVAEVEATTLSRPVAPLPSADATLVFAPPPKARLVGVLGPLVGQSFPVPEHGAFMGRATNADLVVSDAQVSGRHAWIGFVDGNLVLRDQGSTNGTFLNDDLRQPVSETALKAGDVIVLGRQASVKFMVAID